MCSVCVTWFTYIFLNDMKKDSVLIYAGRILSLLCSQHPYLTETCPDVAYVISIADLFWY